MKEHPILFSTAMVQALLAGRKTKTRRIFKNHPRLGSDISKVDLKQWMGEYPDYILSFCPYGKPGDLLWVRESFCVSGHTIKHFIYKANVNCKSSLKWKPSIHMPKAAARIWLLVKDVRVERLQEISDADALAEGIERMLVDNDHYPNLGQTVYKNYLKDKFGHSSKHSFETLWCKIHGSDSWDENRWVWVVEFEVTKKI